MINIVLGIVGFAIVVFGITFAIMQKKIRFMLFAVAGIIIQVFGASFNFVPSGYVGVKTSFGQITEGKSKNGINWHTPFVEQIHLVNCKQIEKDFKDLRIWSETSERTEVYCENVVIDYQIEADQAAWIWKNVEEWDTNLVKQTSVESGIKAATKQFNDTDVTDRSKIESAAKDAIQNSLDTKYQKRIVNIVSVTIGNINFSDAYNEAIEKKAQAKLAAETAEYINQQTTKQKQAEAEQKKIEAEADAEAKKIKAQAEADAIKIKAEAEAEANNKIAESLTPELIEKQKIDKWNGEMPVITGGTSVVDVDDLFTTNN